MERAERFNQTQVIDLQADKRALHEAVDRIFRRVFGCSHRELSRPFTHQGKTYRTCLSCGMHRDFDLHTWKTFGPYHPGTIELRPRAPKLGSTPLTVVATH